MNVHTCEKMEGRHYAAWTSIGGGKSPTYILLKECVSSAVSMALR